MQYANNLEIAYVAMVGEEEIAQSKIKLKNMISGEQNLYTLEECIQILQN